MKSLNTERDKRRLLLKKYEADLRIGLQERSGALSRGVLLSEITGRGRIDMDAFLTEDEYSGPSGAWKVALHHILGRGIPEGFEEATPIIKEFWPHVPPGCIFLTSAEHQHADRNTKMMRPLLLAWILHRYGDRMWEGKPYNHWLGQEPFMRYL